jgi:hypothetical protein
MFPTSPGPPYVTALFVVDDVAFLEFSMLIVVRVARTLPRSFPVRYLTAQW